MNWKEVLKPSWKKILLSIVFYFILSIILDLNSIQFLFFGTSFWGTYWSPFTHISPYYPQTFECMIPEGCPNDNGPETVWTFRMDVLVGVLVKLMLVYLISCLIVNKFESKN